MNKKLIGGLLCAIALLAALSGISLAVAIQRGQDLKDKDFSLVESQKAEKAWKDKYDQIKKTSPGDLVSQSPQSGALEGASDKLADNFDAGVRNRAREILQR